ncbi:hemerythrin [Thermosyntropha lipolytica DSM 11003]|uniref:Hemerythrin n=1 Tax=Thermosyntropha lipolytica DSM 11003 TaxID=1123382 RepID=A0A1M5MZE1_9FIRM|nr:bacteriohemerythrin [Thermosyntropha lipolytica]SHG82597.1 hemerythrin [Thermosyntropha lipolytica DSM 11003]
MINWKEDYTIGVEHIDEQHRRLFEIAGRAYQVMRDDVSIDKYDQIVAILQELKEYTVYHFQSEEEYMQSIGYKKFLSHKVEHNDFIEKINSIDLEKVDEEQDKFILELLDFIVNWIDKHILGMDKMIK